MSSITAPLSINTSTPSETKDTSPKKVPVFTGVDKNGVKALQAGAPIYIPEEILWYLFTNKRIHHSAYELLKTLNKTRTMCCDKGVMNTMVREYGEGTVDDVENELRWMTAPREKIKWMTPTGKPCPKGTCTVKDVSRGVERCEEWSDSD